MTTIIIKCFIYPNLVNSKVLSGHLIRWQGARLRYKAQNKTKVPTTPTRFRRIETNFSAAIRRLHINEFKIGNDPASDFDRFINEF